MTTTPYIPGATKLAETVGAVKQRAEHVFAATENVVAAQRELGIAKNVFLQGGVEGSNEAQRKANLEQLLREETEALASAETELRVARYQHDLAVLDLDLLRYQLRAAEVTVQAQRLGADRAI